MHLDSIKHFNIRNTFIKYQNTNYKGKTTFCCACDRKMWLVVENRSIFCSKSKHYVAQCQQKSSIRRIFDLRKTVFLIVAIWRVSGGLGLSCGGKIFLGRVEKSQISKNLW